MEATGSLDYFVTYYQIIWHDIIKGSDIHSEHREDLKSDTEAG
jgi:hypothetical protein